MPRRILEGQVVSDKNHKTVTVLVERRYRHPVYKKYVKRTDKYAAHDENNQFKVGDKVQIMECRPISRSKRWTVLVDGQVQMEPSTRVSAGPMKAPVAASKTKKAATAKKAAAAKKAKKKDS